MITYLVKKIMLFVAAIVHAGDISWSEQVLGRSFGVSYAPYGARLTGPQEYSGVYDVSYLTSVAVTARLETWTSLFFLSHLSFVLWSRFALNSPHIVPSCSGWELVLGSG